jgi:hypothetical protein
VCGLQPLAFDLNARVVPAARTPMNCGDDSRSSPAHIYDISRPRHRL